MRSDTREWMNKNWPCKKSCRSCSWRCKGFILQKPPRIIAENNGGGFCRALFTGRNNDAPGPPRISFLPGVIHVLRQGHRKCLQPSVNYPKLTDEPTNTRWISCVSPKIYYGQCIKFKLYLFYFIYRYSTAQWKNISILYF